MSTKIKDWDKWWQLAKIKIKISGNKMNTLFYIESYHPIQPGSIDDTNILPNDNAIYGAHLCASAFLFMYLSPSLSLSLSLSMSSNSHNSNSTLHFSLFLLMNPSMIPRSSEILHSLRGLFYFQPFLSFCLVIKKAKRKINSFNKIWSLLFFFLFSFFVYF